MLAPCGTLPRGAATFAPASTAATATAAAPRRVAAARPARALCMEASAQGPRRHHQRCHPRLVACRAGDGPQQPGEAAPPAAAAVADQQLQQQQEPSSPAGSATSSMEGTTRRRARAADSTDPVASFLSRRFGLGAGLGWLGILAVGTIGEQVKTRLEVAAEKAGTTDVQDSKEVVLPSGVRYTDLRTGGGQAPIKGYLVVVDYVGRADGVEFESTRARRKPIVYLYGSRPFTGGICAGVEEAMSTMRAGGRRRITVPPELGFGAQGAVLRPTEHVPDKQGIVPGGATLEYDLELVRVSIPPS